MATPKRGRPAKPETLERRRVEEMLRNMPNHIPRLTIEERRTLALWDAQAEKIQDELIAAHGQWAPHDHAYAMGSIGDEGMIGFEEKILEDDAFFNQRVNGMREKGNATKQDSSKKRQRKVKDINKILIAKIGKGRVYTLHHVARLILEQWEEILPGQRLAGEPKSLSRRGDSGKRPSLRTLQRWLEDCSVV